MPGRREGGRMAFVIPFTWKPCLRRAPLGAGRSGIDFEFIWRTVAFGFLWTHQWEA